MASPFTNPYLNIPQYNPMARAAPNITGLLAALSQSTPRGGATVQNAFPYGGGMGRQQNLLSGQGGGYSLLQQMLSQAKTRQVQNSVTSGVDPNMGPFLNSANNQPPGWKHFLANISPWYDPNAVTGRVDMSGSNGY